MGILSRPAWKSGKFMDLTSRPWSLNSFALSKIWFKCHTVDLRMTDTSSITSKVKSWLYQDQLEKPEEMVLHRPIQMGGLGLHNVTCKAKASLVKTFLETAIHPSFHHSLYHTLLYRAHVLNDDTISNYYSYQLIPFMFVLSPVFICFQQRYQLNLFATPATDVVTQ